jgi:DNA-binding response OmpR family regulator
MEAPMILVVDDEAHVSEMLEEYFAELGYAVQVATTGGEALALVMAERPDAVILDMRLPDTTGDQLLAKFWALDSSLPIVMLSGNDEEDTARQMIAAGALQYLQKPFDFNLLRQTVVAAVDAGREQHCVAR